METTQMPQVIHLGKKSRKEIKKYKQGIGTMHMEVQHVIAQAKQQMDSGKEILPVVVVHKRKKKKNRLW